eukprot:6175-Heterococcus_DN1.PRE.3
MFPAAAGVQQSVNGTVLWSELTRHLSTALYTSPAEWCLECANTAADVCLAAAAASAAKDAASTATATVTASSGGSSSKTAVAAIFALFAGLLGGTVLGRVWSNCRMKRNGTGLIKQPWYRGGVAADEPHAPTRTGVVVGAAHTVVTTESCTHEKRLTVYKVQRGLCCQNQVILCHHNYSLRSRLYHEAITMELTI